MRRRSPDKALWHSIRPQAPRGAFRAQPQETWRGDALLILPNKYFNTPLPFYNILTNLFSRTPRVPQLRICIHFTSIPGRLLREYCGGRFGPITPAILLSLGSFPFFPSTHLLLFNKLRSTLTFSKMSYGCQQGGPDHYGGPQGYGLPLGQSNQGQHLPQGAPQGYPSQQGGFGYPPQSHYPLQSGYVDRPSEQFPPQGQWGAAPYDQFPPQGGFGGPPQQSFGPALVGMPSPGYGPNSIAQGDASQDADTLRRAMKGFGTDEDALILILSKQDVFHMALLVETYLRRFSRNLEADIASETSGDFKEGLLALVRGPRMQDVSLSKSKIL